MAEIPKFDESTPIDEYPSFEETKPLHEEPSSTLNNIKDLIVGATKGSLLNKIGPALASIPTSLVTGESVPEAYDRLQAPLQQDIKTAEERSPGLSLAGELGGALVPGSQIGAAGKALTGGAKLGLLGQTALNAGEGAALGGLSAAAGDTEATPEIETGAVLGAALPFVGKGLGAIGSKLANSSVGKAFKLGTEGVNLGDVNQVATRAKEQVQKAYNPLQNVIEQIGNMRKEALKSATDAGETISMAGRLPYSEEQLSATLNNSPSGLIPDKAKILATLKPFMEEGKTLTPTEAADLNTQLNQLTPKLYGTSIYSVVKELQNNLKDEFKKIPGLATSNKLYSEFLEAGPESLLSKGLGDVDKTSYNSLSRPELSLFKRLKGTVEGLGKNDLEAVQTKQDLSSRLKAFGDENPEILAKSNFGTPEDYIAHLEQAGKESSLYNKGLKPNQLEVNLTKPIESLKTLINPTKIASQAGKGAKILADGAKSLYDATPEILKDYSNQLLNNPSTKFIGQGISDAIESGDQFKKNAAVFALLQNPTARKTLRLGESVE